MNLPHLVRSKWPSDIPKSKFASRIKLNPADCDIALVGIPDDTGVKLNSGRHGASEGPSAFRKALSRMGVADPHGFDWPTVFDAGDIEVVADDLHATHQRVTTAVSAILDLGLFPIAIGGGHDLTFPFVRAVAEHFGTLNGVYFDPHLDVREQDGSGMPFRKLLETKAASELHLHGFDPLSNTAEHTSWFESHGGKIHKKQSAADFQWPASDTFVSLDLDVIDASHAPGVSAMNPCGWSAREAADWVFLAGKNERVRCFDIMELSPPNDHLDRTSRLATHMFLTFLKGFSERTP
ncbi:MAG: formimidoylglutamase [Phycisphaerales bacterium]